MSASELAPVRSTFRALARSIVPETRRLDAEGWADLEAVVEDALRSRPPSMRRQLRVMIRLLRWLPVLRFGRPFTALDDDRRRRFLEAVQDAPVLLLRRGFWGVRSLVFMGYYGRPEVHEEIGYDARLRGRRQRGPVRGRGSGEVPSRPEPGASG